MGPTYMEQGPVDLLGQDRDDALSRAGTYLRCYATGSGSPTSRDTWRSSDLAPRVKTKPVA